MKTVVITGSFRGLGFEMAKVFRKKDFNVVICDVAGDFLDSSKNELLKVSGNGEVLALLCDVTKSDDIDKLISDVLKKFDSIDIWVNNAGVNQPNNAIWELNYSDVNKLIDIDLKGTIYGSMAVIKHMIEQGSGAIYNVEGHGSNDNVILGLSLYGTSKRAVTYFTEALAKEIEIRKLPILIGKLSPGIMITNFIQHALGDRKIELDDKTKNIYNILGDYPSVIAEFLVNNMINNKKNNVKFNWLTNRRVFGKFISSLFNKRNFFD